MRYIFPLLFLLTAIVALANMVLEMRRCLAMMQQNSYRNERYRRWLRSSGDTTRPLRLLAIAVAFIGISTLLPASDPAMLLVLLIVTVSLIGLLRMKMKKPLVMTRRAWRILSVQLLLCAAVIVAVAMLFGGLSVGRVHLLFVIGITALALYCASHIVTMLAVLILQPLENRINRGYVNQARDILAQMPALRVVGITGSYGKTSTKHFLTAILSEQYETLMTPGNYNTLLGVVRVVREMLKPYTEVFVVEMGAKQPDDIAEICSLVHPRYGIITSVGPQHLETFKTLEGVQRTKFELADALPADGLLVANNDFEPIASRTVDNVRTLRYGTDAEADIRITDITYTPAGTRFTLHAEGGEPATFTTPLVGEFNVSNLAAAITMARALGVDERKITQAVARMQPVEHRLSMKQTPGGVTIIDDAYNSNPNGSAMALDVLRHMQGGRKIVVTPGMVELGERQHELNSRLGENIARAADIAIIVNRYNRAAILEGIGDAKNTAVHIVDTFAEGQALLTSLLAPGDIVLYENDLPDTFK